MEVTIFLFMVSEEILQIIKAEAGLAALQRMLRHSGLYNKINS